jgi:hypothetical protein
MADMFAKLLHALATLPFENTPELTVSLHVIGETARFVITGS